MRTSRSWPTGLCLSKAASAPPSAGLAEANRRIDEQSWHVPAYEGRDTLVGQREEATRLYLELLLDTGRIEDAFRLARQARSRLLRQLTVRDRLARLAPREQARWDRALSRYLALRDEVDRQTAAEWQLPIDQREHAREERASQLAQAREDLDRAVAGLGISKEHSETRLLPPRPGEVVLIYHPLQRGWAGFAADERGLAVSRFELPARQLSREALAGILLAPFGPALSRAERVRVLPYGRRLRLVDFHVLPFGGEPLLARHRVVYGLDLPGRPSPAAPDRRAALLVVDPQGDLPAARQEAATVAAAIRTWKPGWTLKHLEGSAARAEEVRAALPKAALFHFAGHGTFAGFAGWDSVLTLSDGSSLTVGDLLALPRAPAWVLLSSCDAARSSEQAPGEGIGLAQAFLLAGSESVIAATRRVPDSVARDLFSELYRVWHPGADLARQLQQAQRACIHSHSASDCASFRLLEP
jgi:cellulose synthase operon protein C